MKYFVVFVALIPFFVISLNPVFAMCANDPVNPNTQCDDLIETLILDSPQTQIENINGMWYYVSEPLMPNLSVDKIVLHDVSFTLPYRNDPPRYTYSDVVFSDGTKETLSVLFDEPAFTEHVNPQAGFVGKTNGYSFLVSVDLKELSPLKQFKSGIPIYEIQCRDNLQLILKTSNNSPTCVKPETKTKLLERGWGEHAPIPEPEIIKETDFDSEKYYEEFDSGSPLMYLDTSNPVLDNDNCERYAYWLTKHQKEKLNKYEDYPRYPPWGNQIFPLVDYCIKNGDLIKTIVNDKIQWSFSGNSEPEFKDEKITVIKISKGEIVSEKAIKFNGWTNQPNQEIVLTVTAPNGNVISTGKLSSMNNGTFVDAITTGGPLWEQQDGIYLITVQQGNEPTNSAYFELELKDGNIITGK